MTQALVVKYAKLLDEFDSDDLSRSEREKLEKFLADPSMKEDNLVGLVRDFRMRAEAGELMTREIDWRLRYVDAFDRRGTIRIKLEGLAELQAHTKKWKKIREEELRREYPHIFKPAGTY